MFVTITSTLMSSRFLAGETHLNKTAKENVLFHTNWTFVFHKAFPRAGHTVIVNSTFLTLPLWSSNNWERRLNQSLKPCHHQAPLEKDRERIQKGFDL